MFDRNSEGKTSHIEWLYESNLRFFGYFKCSTALWLLLWTPAAKATCLQELTGCFRPRLSPDAQNRLFAKNENCIQILDTSLSIYTYKKSKKFFYIFVLFIFWLSLTHPRPLEKHIFKISKPLFHLVSYILEITRIYIYIYICTFIKFILKL